MPATKRKHLRAGEPEMGCFACEQPWSMSTGCQMTTIASDWLRVVVGAETDLAHRYGETYYGYCCDCGADIGRPHHIPCDLETCPRCDEQLSTCGCWMGDA